MNPQSVVDTRDRGAWRRIAVGAIAVATAATMPPFLVGAMAVQISDALDFGTVRLGVAVTAFYAVAAITAVPFGRLADRLGGATVLRVVGPATGAILVSMAVLVRSWAELVIALGCAGAASSAGQPAANQYISAAVPIGRQGIAFGTKQASVPLAVMLSGLAVPTIAITVGYRWAFAGAAALSAATIALVPRRAHRGVQADRRKRRAGGQRRLAALAVLGVALGLGLAAASALSTYLVLSGVHAGLEKGHAGLVAAVGGAVGVAARVISGHLGDLRTGRHFRVVAAMLSVGAFSFVCVSIAVAKQWPALFVPAALVCFAAGWGWNGLFNYAVVWAHRDNPGYATGVTQTGGRIGGIVGPLVLGVFAVHTSYAVAWLVAAALGLAAAPTVMLGRAILRQAAAPGQESDRAAGVDGPGL